MNKAKPIATPQLPNQLTTISNPIQAIKSDESLYEILIIDADLSSQSVKALDISDSKLEKIVASEANLERLAFRDVVLLHSDFTATNCAEASWQRVLLENMRCSGLKLQTSTLKDVTFRDCKLDLANFRFSKLKNVCFIDCILNEADFYASKLDNVQFQSCSLDKTEFSSAKLKQVDLRTSEISNISGISSLTGATIDSTQLIAIAPILANEAQIKVIDD